MQGTLHLQHELKANEAKGHDSGGVYDESAAGRQKITVGTQGKYSKVLVPLDHC